MDRIVITQRIVRILDEISRMQNSLYALNMTDPQKYPENYYILSSDVAQRAEDITCRLRCLVYESTPIKKSDYLAKAAEQHNIRINEQDGVLKISLPSLLPKKRSSYSKFLFDPLYYAFNEYILSHEKIVFDECIIYIAHVYSRGIPGKRPKDYDNVETKQLIDAIAIHFLTDDSGKFIDVHNATEFGETDCTIVYLVDKNIFPEWHKIHLDTVQTTA